MEALLFSNIQKKHIKFPIKPMGYDTLLPS